MAAAGYAVTASIGYKVFQSLQKISTAYASGRRNLYLATRDGKNRVVYEHCFILQGPV
jgi:hypothetical protein